MLPDLQQERLTLDMRRDFPSELGVCGGFGQQKQGEPGFRVMGEAEAIENLVSCFPILLGN